MATRDEAIAGVAQAVALHTERTTGAIERLGLSAQHRHETTHARLEVLERSIHETRQIAEETRDGIGDALDAVSRVEGKVEQAAADAAAAKRAAGEAAAAAAAVPERAAPAMLAAAAKAREVARAVEGDPAVIVEGSSVDRTAEVTARHRLPRQAEVAPPRDDLAAALPFLRRVGAVLWAHKGLIFGLIAGGFAVLQAALGVRMTCAPVQRTQGDPLDAGIQLGQLEAPARAPARASPARAPVPYDPRRAARAQALDELERISELPPDEQDRLADVGKLATFTDGCSHVDVLVGECPAIRELSDRRPRADAGVPRKPKPAPAPPRRDPTDVTVDPETIGADTDEAGCVDEAHLPDALRSAKCKTR